VNNLLGALGSNLETSFATSDFQALIDIAKHTNGDKMISLPFVARPDGAPDLMTTDMVGDISVVVPTAGRFDYSEIQSYIGGYLSNDPIVREAAVIDVLNGSGITGLAQEEANKLKAAGFRIGSVDSAPTEFNGVVEIYQLNSEKSATASALVAKYGVSLSTGAPAEYTPSDGADFVVVVGSGD
jgi:hypothetical protein